MLIWIVHESVQQNAPTTGNVVGANAADDAAPFDRSNCLSATIQRGDLVSKSAVPDWMSRFRALVGVYEEVRWQGLKDGTESRNFVPIRMRLVKHFFDLYDSAVLANDAAATAIMESRLERLANDPSSRWGGLL